MASDSNQDKNRKNVNRPLFALHLTLQSDIPCRVVAKVVGDCRMAVFMNANGRHEGNDNREIRARILEKFCNENVHSVLHWQNNPNYFVPLLSL